MNNHRYSNIVVSSSMGYDLNHRHRHIDHSAWLPEIDYDF